MHKQVMPERVMHKPAAATGRATASAAARAAMGAARRDWSAAVARTFSLMFSLMFAAGAATGQPVGTDTVLPATAAAVDSPALLPVEMFYRHADIGAARLSPSGKHLAVSVNQAGRVALAVFDLAGATPPKIVAHYGHTDVRSFAWVND